MLFESSHPQKLHQHLSSILWSHQLDLGTNSIVNKLFVADNKYVANNPTARLARDFYRQDIDG